MKRTFTLFLAVLMCLSLCACGKNEAVKNTESLIAAIGKVTLDSESAIVAAEEAYAALTAEEKEKVENYTVLTDARSIFDSAKEEYLARRKYIGEWVATQTAYTDSYSFTLMGDGTYTGGDSSWSSNEDPDLPKEWTVVGNGIKVGEKVFIYDDTGDVPKLISYNGNGTISDAKGSYDTITAFIKKEHSAYSEYLITMDNWQEYFTLEERIYPEYNTFGDFDKFIINYTLEIKPEYIDRLVLPRGYFDGITAEIDGDFYTAYCDINPETLEVTYTELIPYAGRLDDYYKMGIVYVQSLWLQYLDETYLSGYEQWNCHNTIAHTAAFLLDDGRWKTDVYCPDPSIVRINGSIFLYDYPVHP